MSDIAPLMIAEHKLLEDASKAGILRLTTGAVVKLGSKILLVRRKPNDFLGGLWEVPGGAINSGESISSGLIRELREETHLELDKMIEYVGSMDYKSSNGIPTRQFTYVVSVKYSSPIILREHDAHKWVEIKDIINFPCSDLLKTMLTKLKI